MVHRVGNMNPQQGAQPRFLQVYTAHPQDPALQLQDRLAAREGQQDQRQREQDEATLAHNREAMLRLQNILNNVNPYVALYKMCAELPVQENLRVVLHHRRDLVPAEDHQRTWNLPTSNEAGIILVGDEGQVTETRDIVQHWRTPASQGEGIQIIKTFHR